jgi:uncharacterized membrane protein HdeD (DUF308 family)
MRIPIRTESGPGIDPEALLTQNWWAVGLRGLAALTFGILAVLWPGATLLTLVVLLAGYFLLDGILAIIAGVRAARHHERWWPFILEGAVNIGAGVVVLLLPGISILALMYLLAVWAIITGGLMVFGGTHFAGAPRWLLAGAGALSVLLGVMMIAQPALGLLALVWWVATYWMAFGVVLLSLAFWLRSHHHHPHATPFAA